MSYEQERKTIEKRMRDNWDSFTVPVQYENVSVLKKGTQTLKDINGLEKFVRLTITPAGGEQIDVGGNADRYFGVITVQVFVKQGLGSAIVRKLVDEVYNIFNRQCFNGILCRTSTMDTIGEVNGWYQVNVNTPFYRETPYTPPIKIT